MKRAELKDSDMRFIVWTLVVVALLLTFGLAIVRPGNRTPTSRDEQHQAQQACIKQGGVPILQGSGSTMTRCEFRGEK